jgi:hypothetical protein
MVCIAIADRIATAVPWNINERTEIKNKLKWWFGYTGGLFCGLTLGLGFPTGTQAQTQMPAPAPLAITGITSNTIGLSDDRTSPDPAADQKHHCYQHWSLERYQRQ